MNCFFANAISSVLFIARQKDWNTPTDKRIVIKAISIHVVGVFAVLAYLI